MNFTAPTQDYAFWLPTEAFATILVVFSGMGLLVYFLVGLIGFDGFIFDKMELRGYIIIGLTILSILTVGIFGLVRTGENDSARATSGADQLVAEAERVYGLELTADIADTLIGDKNIDYLAAGGGDGMRDTLGNAHVVFEDGTKIITLRWMGDEWTLVEGLQDDAVNNGDLPEFPRKDR